MGPEEETEGLWVGKVSTHLGISLWGRAGGSLCGYGQSCPLVHKTSGVTVHSRLLYKPTWVTQESRGKPAQTSERAVICTRGFSCFEAATWWPFLVWWHPGNTIKLPTTTLWVGSSPQITSVCKWRIRRREKERKQVRLLPQNTVQRGHLSVNVDSGCGMGTKQVCCIWKWT